MSPLWVQQILTLFAAPENSENEVSPQRATTGTQRQPTWHLLGFPDETSPSLLYVTLESSGQRVLLTFPEVTVQLFQISYLTKYLPHALTTSNVGTFLVSFFLPDPIFGLIHQQQYSRIVGNFRCNVLFMYAKTIK